MLSLRDNNDDEKLRIDRYWSKVFDEKHCDVYKYPTISKVVKSALSLSHGNGNVERGFSRSGRVLREDKASMTIKMLNSRLTVLDGFITLETNQKMYLYQKYF